MEGWTLMKKSYHGIGCIIVLLFLIIAPMSSMAYTNASSVRIYTQKTDKYATYAKNSDTTLRITGNSTSLLNSILQKIGKIKIKR